MIGAESFYGQHFQNKVDSKVTCTCCGRPIKKGYAVAGMNLGEDCYETINYIFRHEIAENSWKAKSFKALKMHFDWIRSA